MSSIKEIIESESKELFNGLRDILHLHREGSFYRAYEWSAFLSCCYLHDFKVTKRLFKGLEQPVTFIGFPETSIQKWMPEGAELSNIDDKHMVIKLPEIMFAGKKSEELDAEFIVWKDAVPISEPQTRTEKKMRDSSDNRNDSSIPVTTLTSVMQRILAYPIES